MKWYDSIGTGQQAASQSGKRILVFFYAPESAGSKHFEQLFENNSIKGIINSQYVLVRINFIEQTKLAYNLGVYKAGTINLYDAQGNAIRQITDRLTPNEFTANLK
jgi:thioredoxin-related protein